MVEMELTEQGAHQVATALVTVTGEARIATIGELHTVLRTAFASAEDIVLDVEGVTATDTSFFQILCSVHQSSVLNDKQFTLRGGAAEIIAEGRMRCGFASPHGCSMSEITSCLCHGGEK